MVCFPNKLQMNQIVQPVPPPQSDIGPIPPNQTEVGGTSGSPEGLGARASLDRTWNVEDMEGELERKMELLHKNGKALKLESEKHRQEIDRGVNKLHHRIMGLEEGGFPREKEGNRNSAGLIKPLLVFKTNKL